MVTSATKPAISQDVTGLGFGFVVDVAVGLLRTVGERVSVGVAVVVLVGDGGDLVIWVNFAWTVSMAWVTSRSPASSSLEPQAVSKMRITSVRIIDFIFIVSIYDGRVLMRPNR